MPCGCAPTNARDNRSSAAIRKSGCCAASCASIGSGPEGAAISYTYLLWFSTALAAICLGIPLVKLRVLGPRERFSAHDGVWVCVTTFAAAGLLTVIAMDVYVFRYD